jgi:protein transport protein SEC61 subunit gamma-like protein
MVASIGSQQQQLISTPIGHPVTEFIELCRAVAIGFAVMGFIGYFVKLIHIPM